MLLGILLLTPMIAAAKCGGVDYSWGADALATAHDYTVTMMLYVLYLVYAIASIVAIIGALQIYFKMTTGEGDVTKSIMMLIGAIIFIIGASTKHDATKHHCPNQYLFHCRMFLVV